LLAPFVPAFAGTNGESRFARKGYALAATKCKRGPPGPASHIDIRCGRSEARPAARSATSATGTARAAAAARAAHDGLRLHRQQALALHALAGELARPADRFRLLPRLLLGWFLVVAAQLHFAEDALALHLFLERLEGLIDVIV